jgi:CTP synthase (UTP-ammonia lyase)
MVLPDCPEAAVRCMTVRFHPELKSRPFAPHPLFASFIEAAMAQSRLV